MISLKNITRLVSDPSAALDLVRFYLGVGLFVRGALFIAHPEVLLKYMNHSDRWFVPLALSHYVVMAHLCGGVLLALGLRTRLAALVQVPPLIGAVFSVHYAEGLMSAGQSLEFAALVLFLLVVFSAFGSGRYSLDHVLDSDDVKQRESGLAPHHPLTRRAH
jgi:putative oxidoreductase